MAEYVWMKVTEDEYEFPVAIADSARELARILGIKTNSIYSRISHVRYGRNQYTTYKKVRIDEDEE